MSVETPALSVPKTTHKNIDPAGDVCFQLQNLEHKTSIRVSSKILALASPVFDAMFSPYYSEGAALARSSTETAPLELPLPDDPAEAMEIICQVLHFNHDKVPREIAFHRLFQIAKLCDKYDCAISLGPWTEIWMKPLEVYASTPGYENWLFISYVFGNKAVFRVVSRAAMLCSLSEMPNYDSDPLPASIIDTISKTRISLIEKLLAFAEYYRLQYQSPGTMCKKPPRSAISPFVCDAAMLGSLMKQCFACGIYPPPAAPYQEMTVQSIARRLKDLTLHIDQTHDSCMITGELCSKVNAVLSSIVGLDLKAYDKGRGIRRRMPPPRPSPASVLEEEKLASVPPKISGSVFGGGGTPTPLPIPAVTTSAPVLTLPIRGASTNPFAPSNSGGGGDSARSSAPRNTFTPTPFFPPQQTATTPLNNNNNRPHVSIFGGSTTSTSPRSTVVAPSPETTTATATGSPYSVLSSPIPSSGMFSGVVPPITTTNRPTTSSPGRNRSVTSRPFGRPVAASPSSSSVSSSSFFTYSARPFTMNPSPSSPSRSQPSHPLSPGPGSVPSTTTLFGGGDGAAPSTSSGVGARTTTTGLF